MFVQYGEIRKCLSTGVTIVMIGADYENESRHGPSTRRESLMHFHIM